MLWSSTLHTLNPIFQFRDITTIIVLCKSPKSAFLDELQCLEEWETTEKWLQDKYTKAHPEFKDNGGKFSILGYQWRVLRFNDSTRQSTVKVMAAYKNYDSQPGSVYLMQQPHCLAVPCNKII